MGDYGTKGRGKWRTEDGREKTVDGRETMDEGRGFAEGLPISLRFAGASRERENSFDPPKRMAGKVLSI